MKFRSDSPANTRMELRGQVRDPFGEAACDTSAYQGCIVQLWALGDAPSLSKRAALGAEPGSQPIDEVVLPDQGGWPRSFRFEGLAPGRYTVLAFVDTMNTGKLDFRSTAMSQPLGWAAEEGAWGGAQSVVTVSEEDEEPPFVSVVLRAPTRFGSAPKQCEGGWYAELKGQPVLHLRGDGATRGCQRPSPPCALLR